MVGGFKNSLTIPYLDVLSLDLFQLFQLSLVFLVSIFTTLYITTLVAMFLCIYFYLLLYQCVLYVDELVLVAALLRNFFKFPQVGNCDDLNKLILNLMKFDLRDMKTENENTIHQYQSVTRPWNPF